MIVAARPFNAARRCLTRTRYSPYDDSLLPSFVRFMVAMEYKSFNMFEETRGDTPIIAGKENLFLDNMERYFSI